MIDPHGGRATDGDRHHEQVHHRDGGEEGDQGTEAQALAAALLESVAHGDEIDLVVVERIVDVLDRHHPGTEQEPEHGSQGLADHGDEEQDETTDRLGQVVFELDPLTAEGTWHILDDIQHAAVIRGLAGEDLLHLLRQQTVEGGGYPVRHRAEHKGEDHQYGHQGDGPEQIVQPVEPGGDLLVQPGEQTVQLQQQGVEGTGKQHEVDQQGDQDEGADTGLADERKAAQEVIGAADWIFYHTGWLAHMSSICSWGKCLHITNKPLIW